MYPGSCKRPVERRPGQEDEPVRLAHELTLGGAHRCARALAARIFASRREPPTTGRSSRSGIRGSSPSRRVSRHRGRRAGTTRRPTRRPRSGGAGRPPWLATSMPPQRHRCASQSAAKRSITSHRNHPSQTLSPRPSMPTRFIPSFQSPAPMRGSPWVPCRHRALERPSAVFEKRRRSPTSRNARSGRARPGGGARQRGTARLLAEPPRRRSPRRMRR